MGTEQSEPLRSEKEERGKLHVRVYNAARYIGDCVMTCRDEPGHDEVAAMARVWGRKATSRPVMS